MREPRTGLTGDPLAGANIPVYIADTLSVSDRSPTLALLDPFGGLAGDMLLGALLDLEGALEDELREPLSSLGLPNWELTTQTAVRRALGCVKANFAVPDEVDHRHLPEIRERIAASALPERAKQKADETFVLLAGAEAEVHRIPVEKVHFHEVGAADAILDICAVSFCLDRLGVEKLLCGPLPGGSGTIRCAHGDMPCPAPAVVHLLEDFVVLAGVGEGEMVTPTGAALLRAWGRPLTAGELGYRTRGVGYGAGSRAASVLRVSLVEADDPALVGFGKGEGLDEDGFERDFIHVVETNLDDERPELLGFLSERLLELGAVDVCFSPRTMKKGRPGVALEVLVPPPRRAAIVAAILRETTALGVREQLVARTILTREIVKLDTPWGPVRIKRAGGRDRLEYEDLARIARAQDLPLREVHDAVTTFVQEAREDGWTG